MPTLPPEYEVEVERRVERRVKEQAQALELSGLGRELKAIRRWQIKVNKQLEDNNHLRRDMATKKDLEEALAHMVVVQQLGDGDYSVRLGDVVLGPEDVDELPLALHASRSAREAAASASQAAISASQASTLRSLWMTAIATAAGALVAACAALAGALVFLHARGVV